MKIDNLISGNVSREQSQLINNGTPLSKNIFLTSLYSDSFQKMQEFGDTKSKFLAPFIWIKDSVVEVFLYMRSWILWRKKITPDEMIQFVNTHLAKFASTEKNWKKCLGVIAFGEAAFRFRLPKGSTEVSQDMKEEIVKFCKENNRDLYGELGISMCSILPATLFKKERVDWSFVGDRNFTAQLFKGDRAAATEVQIQGTPKWSKETIQKSMEKRLEEVSSKALDKDRIRLMRFN